MNEISTESLFAILVGLIVLSGFFSGSETGLMTLNRYRLKHRAEKGHRGARLARQLLRRPDRLLGMILLGNNIVNIFAATIATVLAIRLYGEVGIAVAPFVLTFVILIFAEVAPKTLAALKPEMIAYPVLPSSPAIMRAILMPEREALRAPTIATAGRANTAALPRMAISGGGWSILRSMAG